MHTIYILKIFFVERLATLLKKKKKVIIICVVDDGCSPYYKDTALTGCTYCVHAIHNRPMKNKQSSITIYQFLYVNKTSFKFIIRLHQSNRYKMCTVQSTKCKKYDGIIREENFKYYTYHN